MSAIGIGDDRVVRGGQRRRDPWRVGAVAGSFLLLPTTVAAWLYVLSTAAFARCLTYGENCDPMADLWLPVAWWAFWISAVTGILAASLPRRMRHIGVVRPVLVVVHATTQVITFAAVVQSA